MTLDERLRVEFNALPKRQRLLIWKNLTDPLLLALASYADGELGRLELRGIASGVLDCLNLIGTPPDSETWFAEIRRWVDIPLAVHVREARAEEGELVAAALREQTIH